MITQATRLQEPRDLTMLADRGWRTRAGSSLSAAQAHGGARPTLDASDSSPTTVACGKREA